MRKLAEELNDLNSETVQIGGWITSRRDHGKLLFIDISDRTGITQVLFLPGVINEEQKKSLKLQSAIIVEGIVQNRPDNLINNEIISGKIEIKAEKILYLSESKDLPFEINQDTKIVNENTRIKYRYLDLRSERMHKNVFERHNIVRFIREYLYKEGFCEIETPFLTRSTPEGARDYLVPSRVSPSNFYALPQSPQQYKQLLMVSRFEKYFQIVRCFRDEDQRADRLPEFTQVDMEMSFIEQEDILKITEKMIIELVTKLYPKKKITLKPFPRLDFNDVIKRYGTDKPDLRENKNNNDELAFAWIVNFPMFEYKKGDKRWGAVHHPFTSIVKEDIDKIFIEKPDLENIRAQQYDLVLNGNEIFGGSIRTTDPHVLAKVFELLGSSKEEIKEKFGHLLKAFEYGVPPHGGIACGLDRLIMVLAKEDNIREVIAFPKLGDGFDPLMEAPAKVSPEQLAELKIHFTNDRKN